MLELTHPVQVVEVDIILPHDEMKDFGTIISKAIQKHIVELEDYHAFAIVGGGMGITEPRLLIGFSTVRENRVTLVTDMLMEHVSSLREFHIYFGHPTLKE